VSTLISASESIKSGNGAAGEVLANASKCAAQLPGLAAAHNAMGLAAESQGGPGKLREAVGAYETALALLDRQRQQRPSGRGDPQSVEGDAGIVPTYLGAGPAPGSLLIQSLGGSEDDAQALAVRLNLARSLSKLGNALGPAAVGTTTGSLRGDGAAVGAAAPWADACRRAVALYRELEAQGLMQSDASAWLAYASEE